MVFVKTIFRTIIAIGVLGEGGVGEWVGGNINIFHILNLFCFKIIVHNY